MQKIAYRISLLALAKTVIFSKSPLGAKTAVSLDIIMLSLGVKMN